MCAQLYMFTHIGDSLWMGQQTGENEPTGSTRLELARRLVLLWPWLGSVRLKPEVSVNLGSIRNLT